MRSVLALALLLVGGASNAMPMQLDFTAVFQFGPVQSVSGSFSYDAASATAPIDSLTGIALTMSDHTYSLSEIGFLNQPGGVTIGGTIAGVDTMQWGTDDFRFVFDPSNSFTPR
jgi:hypothetical protein